MQLYYFLFLSSPSRKILVQWLRVGLKSKSCTKNGDGTLREKASGEIFLFVIRKGFWISFILKYTDQREREKFKYISPAGIILSHSGPLILLETACFECLPAPETCCKSRAGFLPG